MLEEVKDSDIAYLIGFLAGDGNFSDGRGKRKDRMGLTTTDPEVVEWINARISPFDKDTCDQRIGDNEDRGIYGTKMAYKKIFSSKESQDFRQYGILAKKKDRVVKNIKKRDYNHFLRGFLDSDGHISFSMRKDRNRLAGKFGFTHPSYKLLEHIQTFLMEELDIPSSIKPKSNEDCYVLQCSKLRDVKKFGDYVYGTKEGIVISKKYHKYKELCEILEEGVDKSEIYPYEFVCSHAYRSLIGSVSQYFFIDPDGNEYESANQAAEKHGIDGRLVRQRCRTDAKGWSRRVKTNSEVKDHRKYIDRQTKKLFEQWKRDNPDYY